jgi:CRP-like cAMP-binding protein
MKKTMNLFKTATATETAELYRLTRETLAEMWTGHMMTRQHIEGEIACLRRHDYTELADLWESKLNANPAEEIDLVELCDHNNEIIAEVVDLAYYTSLEI